MTLNSTANLTTGDTEKNLHLTTRQRQLLQLRCISYLANGMSILDIAKEEGITMWHARQVLDRINQEARNSLLSNMVSERVPLQVEISLETHRILIKKLFAIMNSPNSDGRLQAQCASQIASINGMTNEILSSSSMIANAIKKVLIIHPPTTSQPQLEEEESDNKENAAKQAEEGGQGQEYGVRKDSSMLFQKDGGVGYAGALKGGGMLNQQQESLFPTADVSAGTTTNETNQALRLSKNVTTAESVEAAKPAEEEEDTNHHHEASQQPIDYSQQQQTQEEEEGEQA